MTTSALRYQPLGINALKERFFSLVAPDLPNEWEVEEAMEELTDADPALVDEILSQVPAIWPVSNSLCYNYLGQALHALSCFPAAELGGWVNETLDRYEKGGLQAAQRFMTNVEQEFVCRLRGIAGLRFDEVRGRLLPYIRGLSGRELDLAPAARACTDGDTIFLPHKISMARDGEQNFLLYKFTASFQWAFLEQGTFFPDSPLLPETGEEAAGQLALALFFDSLAQPELAADLYLQLESIRARAFLGRELPGLVRETVDLLPDPLCRQETGRVARLLIALQCCCLTGEPDGVGLPGVEDSDLRHLLQPEATAAHSLALCRRLYTRLCGQVGEYHSPEPLFFQGTMRLDLVAAARSRRRQELGERFVDALTTALLTLPPSSGGPEEKKRPEGAGAAGTEVPDVALILDGDGKGGEEAEQSAFLRVDNEQVVMDEELEHLGRQVIDEFGFLPPRFVSSAAGRAGRAMAAGDVGASVGEQPLVAPVTYDEWDHRRGGFRKSWCIMTEKEIPVTRSTFITATLARYRGQIIRLRNQFEMMRTTERFLRRQRDGDDIDLDALVESLADSRAGLPPSDRLFVRLARDERDIAALFLVDMSNSTQGWVGTAIKEALVLICEAMEKVGDRYGIYGFSGMRRLRCETFHIKHLEEPYGETVRQRIGSIAPQEYTRMAPAIRHMTARFADVDARIRLLVILSDGKPEDYDDYKGEYAIEDTRHALLEARSAGIHPFCITIDHHAHEYMAHMYGTANSIFIDDVRKLPARMPEIYRVLTS